MDKERSDKIDKVRKMRALSASESKLGNKGAAETASRKAQEMITKYSITTSELNEPAPPKPEYKSYNSPEEAMREHTRQQKKAYQTEKDGPYYDDPRYGRTSNRDGYFEDAEDMDVEELLRKFKAATGGDPSMDHLFRQWAEMKREGNRHKKSYSSSSYEEIKVYRYKNSFKCKFHPEVFIHELADRARCQVEFINTKECEWKTGFFSKTATKFECDFSVMGSANNLTRFKQYYQAYSI
jgi:hypothetical protein